jgi:hypothetical protein
MKLTNLKSALRQHPGQGVRFVLPDGNPIPAEFHVTEVGHVVKKFIDCGGTVRIAESCLLQAWVSPNDPDHALTTDKLASILALSAKVLPSDDLDVEVEYGAGSVAQHTVESFASRDGALHVTLGDKHTDCLAKDACGIEPVGCGCGPGQCC